MRYAVESSLNGLLYGLYEAESADEAIETMAKDFGFESFDSMCIEHDPHQIAGYRRSFSARNLGDGLADAEFRMRGMYGTNRTLGRRK